jgi:DNA-binding transcriptional LysR family regulator
MQYRCANMHSSNWDDLRYILAVAREGGVSRAARSLEVNHSTVLRHIGAFEARHGVALFDRRSTGYELTAHGREVLQALQSVEGAVAEVERKIAGHGERLEGTLHITTTDAILEGVVGPCLGGFARLYPNIVADLRITNTALNLSYRDADVAIRPSRNPPEELIGVPVGTIGVGIFGEREYVRKNGHKPLDAHPWLGLGELMARTPPALWMKSTLPEVKVVMSGDSFLTLRAAAAQGVGVALLPRFVGDQCDALSALGPPLQELDTTLWLLAHPDLRRSPLVRVFFDYFGEAMRNSADLLAGIANDTT